MNKMCLGEKTFMFQCDLLSFSIHILVSKTKPKLEKQKKKVRFLLLLLQQIK